MKKIIVNTSGPNEVWDMATSTSMRFVPNWVIPEQTWLHPRERKRELVRTVNEWPGTRPLVVTTWDELSMLILVKAAAEGVAEVEVRYFLDVDKDPIVLKVDERGSLPSWPDPNGFFTERESVLFSGEPLFRKETP